MRYDSKGDAEIRLAWLRAHHDAQRELIDTQKAFQSSMIELQEAFLRVVEASFASLGRVWDREGGAERPPDLQAEEDDSPPFELAVPAISEPER